MRILIAEDEPELAKGLKYLLEKNNYAVDIVFDGAEALEYLHNAEYDAVILDVMMPKKSGLEVLRIMRREQCRIPVMMLTAKSEIEDRVLGLETGADDYLPKPFSTRELIARVKALVRRNEGYAEDTIKYGEITLDCLRYELSKGRMAVRLNNKEFRIMELFMRNPHVVFSTNHIMDKIWDAESEAGVDVVWTYIGFLRKKLKEIHSDVEIRTIRGVGYSLEQMKR